MSSKYVCQPLLASFYGLTRSFTKSVIVGMENTYPGDQVYSPVVRILGDKTGEYISLSENGWRRLAELFGEMDTFFEGGAEMQGDVVRGVGFCIRYVYCHSTKGIELIDGDDDDDVPSNKDENGEPLKKRPKGPYRRSLVFQRQTIEQLKVLARCIDYKIVYLNMMKGNIKILFKRIADYVIEKIESNRDAQTMSVSWYELLQHTKDVDEIITPEKYEEFQSELHSSLTYSQVKDAMLEIITLHSSNLRNVIDNILMSPKKYSVKPDVP